MNKYGVTKMEVLKRRQFDICVGNGAAQLVFCLEIVNLIV
jgi:hypothetical protein